MDVVGSPCEPPATAQAYVFNATVVPTGALGYLTLWPDGATEAAGLDLERTGWLDHQQHGHRAQHQRQDRCLCVRDSRN